MAGGGGLGVEQGGEVLLRGENMSTYQNFGRALAQSFRFVELRLKALVAIHLLHGTLIE